LTRIVEQYLRKGSKIYLEGQLQTRKWQDQNGQDKYTTEVVLQGFNSTLTMLDSRRDGQNDVGGSSDYGGTPPLNDDSGGGKSYELDDDIPF